MVLAEHRGRLQGTTVHQAEHLVLVLPWPNIKPITFPCRADACYATDSGYPTSTTNFHMLICCVCLGAREIRDEVHKDNEVAAQVEQLQLLPGPPLCPGLCTY